MPTLQVIPAVEALQTMAIITPNARPSPLNTSIGQDVRGLARNLTTELAAKTTLLNATASPQHRAGIELVETTVLFNRT
jgi:hypothetical protein